MPRAFAAFDQMQAERSDRIKVFAKELTDTIGKGCHYFRCLVDNINANTRFNTESMIFALIHRKTFALVDYIKQYLANYS